MTTQTLTLQNYLVDNLETWMAQDLSSSDNQLITTTTLPGLTTTTPPSKQQQIKSSGRYSNDAPNKWKRKKNIHLATQKKQLDEALDEVEEILMDLQESVETLHQDQVLFHDTADTANVTCQDAQQLVEEKERKISKRLGHHHTRSSANVQRRTSKRYKKRSDMYKKKVRSLPPTTLPNKSHTSFFARLRNTRRHHHTFSNVENEEYESKEQREKQIMEATSATMDKSIAAVHNIKMTLVETQLLSDVAEITVYQQNQQLERINERLLHNVVDVLKNQKKRSRWWCACS